MKALICADSSPDFASDFARDFPSDFPPDFAAHPRRIPTIL